LNLFINRFKEVLKLSTIIWDVLARVNKWWLDPSEIRFDKHVSVFEQSTIKWNPKVFTISDIVDGVYTLRGPRQVGKTTMLKLLIKELLDSNFSSDSIIYVMCDLLENSEHLLKLLVDIRKRVKGRIVIILDEVTFIKEWQKAVKLYVDQDFLKETTIIACGSHALDLKKGATYLVGRRGYAKHPIDRILLAMSFREYVEMKFPQIKKIETLDDVLSMDSLKREAIIEKLYFLFLQYLETGGFPRLIDEFNKEGSIRKESINDFINYLSRDVIKLGKSDILARALLEAIIKQRCNPTSWNSLAREIGISQPTAREYGELLTNMYIVKMIYHPNRSFTGGDERKNKKLIIRDPALYHIITLWIHNFPEVDMNPKEIILRNLENEQQYIVEMTALENISRNNITYYWKPSKEIDAIIIKNKKAIGIEIKWQEKITKSQIRDTIRTFAKIPLKKEKLIIATKNQFQQNDTVILIPTPLLLALKKI